MSDVRNEAYAQGLSRLIQAETVSAKKQSDKSKFYAFHEVLRQEYPTLFSVCCAGREKPQKNLFC